MKGRTQTADEKKPPSQVLASLSQLPICRICMEAVPDLDCIVPCNCQGSLKYVHEPCLKIWLIRQHPQLEGARCELCTEDFTIVRSSSNYCTLQRAFRERMPQCVLLLILIISQSCLAVLTVLIIDDLLKNSGTVQDRRNDVTLVIVAVLATIILSALIIHTAKESCTNPFPHHWTIFSKEKSASTREDNNNEARQAQARWTKRLISITQPNFHANRGRRSDNSADSQAEELRSLGTEP